MAERPYQMMIPPVEDVTGLGPAMRAINPKQRAFVYAMLETGGASAARAAAMSGYGTTPGSQKVTAHRLAHDSGILSAIREESEKRIQAHVMLGASQLARIAGEDGHKDQFKAALALLDRGGLLVASEHKITVDHGGGSNKEVIDRIKVLADALGLDQKKLLGHAGVTDAEFTVLAPEMSSDGLEDLLG